MEISAEVYQELLLRYNNLRNDLIVKRKKLVSDSVLCSLMVMTSKERLLSLSGSSIDVTYPDELAKFYIAEQVGFLHRFYQKNKITMIFTAKGIFRLEEYLDRLDEVRLLDFIQDKYLQLDESSRKLNYKEKTVLLTLLAMHCFGENNAMELETASKQDVWFRLLNETSFLFLKQEGVVLASEKLLPDSIETETPATYLMRRLNDLSKKTAGIFLNPGGSKYYLDLNLGDHAETLNMLGYLFELILPDFVTYKFLSNMKTFLERTYQEYVPITHGKMNPEDEDWTIIINKTLDSFLLR